MMVVTFSITRDGHAERGGKRCRSMPGSEGVVVRFITAKKTTEAAILFDGAKLIATAGENLMGIGLMAHIPNQTITRSIESVMKRHGKLDRAQGSARVAAHARHCFQNVLA